jgi:hypothetical protein
MTMVRHFEVMLRQTLKHSVILCNVISLQSTWLVKQCKESRRIRSFEKLLSYQPRLLVLTIVRTVHFSAPLAAWITAVCVTAGVVKHFPHRDLALYLSPLSLSSDDSRANYGPCYVHTMKPFRNQLRCDYQSGSYVRRSGLFANSSGSISLLRERRIWAQNVANYFEITTVVMCSI